MLGAVLWLISVAGVCVLFDKEFLTSPLIGYYILNTALMLGIALSLSYLVGIFCQKQQYAEWNLQPAFTGNVLSVRSICPNEYYEQKRP